MSISYCFNEVYFQLLDDGDGLILPGGEVVDEYEEWATAGPSLSIDYAANRNGAQNSVDRAALEADAKLSAVVESVASTASFMQGNDEEVRFCSDHLTLPFLPEAFRHIFSYLRGHNCD